MFKSSPLVKRWASSVPLVLHGVDGRYATALFNAAQKTKALEIVEKDLTSLNLPLLMDPLVKDKQTKVLALLKDNHVLTRNFFKVLAQNGRLNLTPKILLAFDSLMAASRGHVDCVVTSTTKLDSEIVKIRDILSKSNLIAPGSKLVIENKVLLLI
jgi:F-type H+-transporting ATPase subunit O